MTDWVTISSLATAGGTLALAAATFVSTQSANRNTRVAELALRQQLRPVIVNSQLEDPAQRIMFFGERWVEVPGSGAVVEYDDGVIYLSISVRNVGTGIGLLRGWYPWPDASIGLRGHVEPDQFRTQIRDLLIPAGGIGLWQGALRNEDEEIHGAMRDIAADSRLFMLDLLYTDHLGEQPAVSRFSIAPTGDGHWVCSATRHWDLPGF